tara:strand:- start:3025 stop:3240 length:216 start_codon:yes stop_codon:yes gene_type:complete
MEKNADYLTDGNGTFVINQQQAEQFFNCNIKTLKRWRDSGQIKYKEVCSGVYYYIIETTETSDINTNKTIT